jgi:hypothetical protein
VTNSLMLGRSPKRTVSLCVVGLLAATGLLVGSPGLGGNVIPSAGAATATKVRTVGVHCPTGSAPGITSHQVNVAASIIDVSSGSLTNATVGVPSTKQQEADYNLLAKKINSEGGAGCRKIVMSYFDVNPVDAANAQQACLTMASAHPYIVLDSGALTAVGAASCIPEHHILLASSYLTPDDLKTYHPYTLAIGGNAQDAIHTGISALHQLGYFSAAKGFKKLGVMYHTCAPGSESLEQSGLEAAHVDAKSVDYFNLGCPSGQTDTPASMEQAVLAFKDAGVTDVTEIAVNDWGLFTQVAQQQHFNPHYVFTDSAAAASNFTGTDAPDPTNFNGTVNIVEGGYGEATTPGFKPSSATKTCDAIFAAGGQPSVYKQPDGYGGFVCGYMWFVQALLNHASSVQPTAQVSSMHKIGVLDLPYAMAPLDFSASPAGSAYGVGEWRAVYYHASCKCWQVPNAAFHKAS